MLLLRGQHRRGDVSRRQRRQRRRRGRVFIVDSDAKTRRSGLRPARRLTVRSTTMMLKMLLMQMMWMSVEAVVVERVDVFVVARILVATEVLMDASLASSNSSSMMIVHHLRRRAIRRNRRIPA